MLSGDFPNWVGRPVQKEFDFNVCRRWISTCSEQHVKCKTVEDQDIPTRLIDIGDAEQEPKLVHTSGRRGKYVALSHCWGKSQPPKTTTTTSAKHALSIPFATLPKTFQDAVIATRRLGFRYLWIDCFCIPQDSESDWQHECASMHKTFANAVVTIAGPGADSANAGFLLKQHVAPAESAPIRVRNVNSTSAFCLLEVVRSGRTPLANVPSENKQLYSSLLKRGWIMQERLLSSRVLYFGQQQLYFECNSVDYHENLCYPIQPESAGEVGDDATVTKHSFSSVDTAEILQNWYRIVVAYTSCQLTEGRDKLPALSGLASRCHTLTKDQYLAGLWRNGLEKGLTWYRDEDSIVRKSSRPAIHDAPSWTWASCDYKVLFEGFATFGRKDMKPQITINSMNVNPVGLDPFGEVTGGDMGLTGNIREAILQRGPDSSQNIHWLYPTWSDGDTRTIAQCYMDEPEPSSHHVSDERPVACLLLGTQSRTDDLRAGPESLIALVLEPAQGRRRNAFRRLGL